MTPVDIETRLRASLQELTSTTPLAHPDLPREDPSASTPRVSQPPLAKGFARRQDAAHDPRRRMRVVVGALIVLVVVVGLGVALAAGPRSGAPGGSRPASVGAKSFALPSDGWRPNDSEMLALIGGPFHAVMTPQGACAWLGSAPHATYLWPAGYRVRFHPTELIGPGGDVVATEGQKISFAGGGGPGQTTRLSCAGRQEQVFLLEGLPQLSGTP
jgi:hypothetical protein